ncbi:hypothetical protein GW793_03035 [bacterium]|uniref:Uncharacterized protein n=2 Tax=Katanobacteria TaxID=422282 RepID=A0A2M7X2R2_UNCKA|nr:hypothetical protein [bacterium]PIP56455.1 MAG: hypothetical protein COX05_03025 [candidate division WWE3 bacterium CG22_combo_CG10-13_8_21_14_all_39_12]PJA40466.1 MAG: hypothetical protein CO179_02195 [candidate division WWE3 bacterium CG_4_9_14_3_um_filter_39_7]
MYLYVDPDDGRAVRFAQFSLGARQQTVNRWYLPGGGTIPIGLQVIPDVQMPLGKKKVRGEYVPKLWVLNDRTKLAIEGIGSEFPRSLPVGLVVSETQCTQGLQGEEESSLLGQLRQESTVDIPKEHHHRGGGVLVRHLSGFGRVVTTREQAARIGRGNSAVLDEPKAHDDLSPSVLYGTTDVANVFELLEALKVGVQLRLPVVFDTYNSAHTIGDYWMRIMQPSLVSIGTQMSLEDLGFNSEDKFGVPSSSSTRVKETFRSAGLTAIADRAAFLSTLNSCTFASWYRSAHEEIARRVLAVTGNSARTRAVVVSTESILSRTSMWHWTIGYFASQLERLAKRPVMMLHTPDGQALLTNAVHSYAQMTIAEFHQIGGWLGGAAMYQSMYMLGNLGGVVLPVKDSSAGDVHLFARPYLEDPRSGLHLTPVGLFRLTVPGQNEDWTIDPWVFLEFLERWGKEKSGFEIQKIWDAIEVPLAVTNIGTKTVAMVTENGIYIATK